MWHHSPWEGSKVTLVPLGRAWWQAGLSPIHLGAAGTSDKCHQEPSGAGSAWPAGSWLGAGAPAPGLDGKPGCGQLLLL